MILVAGGTGSLGSRVARTLLAQGEAVRLLARDPAAAAPLRDAGAEIVLGDLKRPETLAPACEGIEIVITTANSAKRAGEDTVETVDRQGNRALIEAAAGAGVRRFVFVSALGADAASPVPFLRAKGETEVRLRESGMEYTIVQPDVFMDVWFPMIVEGPLATRSPVTLVGGASRKHSFVAEADVAAFVVAAARHPAARNATLVVGGPDALSWKDVVRVYEEATGRRIDVRSVAPGTPLPGLPDVVSALAASFETYDSVIPMNDAARAYGVTLTPARAFAARRTGEGGAAAGDGGHGGGGDGGAGHGASSAH